MKPTDVVDLRDLRKQRERGTEQMLAQLHGERPHAQELRPLAAEMREAEAPQPPQAQEGESPP